MKDDRQDLNYLDSYAYDCKATFREGTEKDPEFDIELSAWPGKTFMVKINSDKDVNPVTKTHSFLIVGVKLLSPPPRFDLSKKSFREIDFYTGGRVHERSLKTGGGSNLTHTRATVIATKWQCL